MNNFGEVVPDVILPKVAPAIKGKINGIAKAVDAWGEIIDLRTLRFEVAGNETLAIPEVKAWLELKPYLGERIFRVIISLITKDDPTLELAWCEEMEQAKEKVSHIYTHHTTPLDTSFDDDTTLNHKKHTLTRSIKARKEAEVIDLVSSDQGEKKKEVVNTSTPPKVVAQVVEKAPTPKKVSFKEKEVEKKPEDNRTGMAPPPPSYPAHMFVKLTKHHTETCVGEEEGQSSDEEEEAPPLPKTTEGAPPKAEADNKSLVNAGVIKGNIPKSDNTKGIPYINTNTFMDEEKLSPTYNEVYNPVLSVPISYLRTGMDSFKTGPDVTPAMALLIMRPQALLAVGDCPFPIRDPPTISAMEHIVKGKPMTVPKHIRTQRLAVDKPRNAGCGMLLCYEGKVILRTDMKVFRIKRGWFREEVAHVNNLLATVESPIYFGTTSKFNAPERVPNALFAFTVARHRYAFDFDTEVAVHRVTRNKWWLEIRGSPIITVDGWGKVEGIVTPEEAWKSKRPVYVESIFGKPREEGDVCTNRIDFLNHLLFNSPRYADKKNIYVSMQEGEEDEGTGEENQEDGESEQELDPFELSMSPPPKENSWDTDAGTPMFITNDKERAIKGGGGFIINPLILASEDGRRVLEDARLEIIQRDKDWSIPYEGTQEKEEVEEEPRGKKRKVDWYPGALTVEKLARMACKATGGDPDALEKDMFEDTIRKALSSIPNVEIISPTKPGKAIPKGTTKPPPPPPTPPATSPSPPSPPTLSLNTPMLIERDSPSPDVPSLPPFVVIRSQDRVGKADKRPQESAGGGGFSFVKEWEKRTAEKHPRKSFVELFAEYKQKKLEEKEEKGKEKGKGKNETKSITFVPARTLVGGRIPTNVSNPPPQVVDRQATLEEDYNCDEDFNRLFDTLQEVESVNKVTPLGGGNYITLKVTEGTRKRVVATHVKESINSEKRDSRALLTLF